MCFSSPKADTSAISAQQAQTLADEKARQDRINQGQTQIDSVFSGYNPSYYDNLNKQYLDYYNPQLKTQEDNAQQKLLFNSTDQGNLNSSGYAKQLADLQKQEGVQQQQILSSADAYSNNAKSQVANLKNTTQQQLQASGDNTGINSQLLNQLNIQPASSLSPLAQVFSGLVGSAGQIGANTAYQGGSLLGSSFYNQPKSNTGASSTYISG